MEPEIDASYEFLYEDKDVIIVSKSGNCPVHEGGLYKENCLTRLLEKKLGFRVFPVYRLDRETSGIVIFAKNAEKAMRIAASITEKQYTAICKGEVKPQIVNAPIAEIKGEHIKWKKGVTEKGVNAITEIIESVKIGNFSLIKIIPKTGRQHQIRVHLQHICAPIIGDKIYNESDLKFKQYLEGKEEKNPLIKRQALHLGKIIYDRKIIEAKMPEDMKELVKKLSYS